MGTKVKGSGLVKFWSRDTREVVQGPVDVFRLAAGFLSYTPIAMSLLLSGWGLWVFLPPESLPPGTFSVIVFDTRISELSWGLVAGLIGSAALWSMILHGLDDLLTQAFWLGVAFFWLLIAALSARESFWSTYTYQYGAIALITVVTLAIPVDFIAFRARKDA